MTEYLVYQAPAPLPEGFDEPPAVGLVRSALVEADTPAGAVDVFLDGPTGFTGGEVVRVLDTEGAVDFVIDVQKTAEPVGEHDEANR